MTRSMSRNKKPDRQICPHRHRGKRRQYSFARRLRRFCTIFTCHRTLSEFCKGDARMVSNYKTRWAAVHDYSTARCFARRSGSSTNYGWEHMVMDFRNDMTAEKEPEAGVFGHCHYHVFSIENNAGFLLREYLVTVFNSWPHKNSTTRLAMDSLLCIRKLRWPKVETGSEVFDLIKSIGDRSRLKS
jgi:hypothetical protein